MASVLKKKVIMDPFALTDSRHHLLWPAMSVIVQVEQLIIWQQSPATWNHRALATELELLHFCQSTSGISYFNIYYFSNEPLSGVIILWWPRSEHCQLINKKDDDLTYSADQ